MRKHRGVAALVALILGLGGLVVVASGVPADARHNFSMLAVSPQQAAAGDEVTVSGFSYTKTAVVRFGALDGPVLARLEPDANNDIRGTVRIPPEARPGRHVLFAMHQDEQGKPTRFPGRAAVVVSGPGGPPLGVTTGLALEPRPRDVLQRDSASPGSLVLVAVATAGAGCLLAGVVLVLLAGRRRVADGAPL